VERMTLTSHNTVLIIGQRFRPQAPTPSYILSRCQISLPTTGVLGGGHGRGAQQEQTRVQLSLAPSLRCEQRGGISYTSLKMLETAAGESRAADKVTEQGELVDVENVRQPELLGGR